MLLSDEDLQQLREEQNQLEQTVQTAKSRVEGCEAKKQWIEKDSDLSKKLTEAGYDAASVQKVVNELMKK